MRPRMGTFETYKFLSTLSLRRATIHVGDYIPFNCTFLSTLSLRRATKLVQLSPLQYGYFYPRSPCGERPECHLQISRENGISIHALLAESDFNANYLGSQATISIHALLAESDVTARIIDPTYGKISIHALLAESDPFSRSGPMTHRYFYPRSPCGERLQAIVPLIQDAVISIHALLAESDGHPSSVKSLIIISIHALLAESDRNGHPDTRQRDAISIHALLAESDLNLATS